jgi:hypothetical protein
MLVVLGSFQMEEAVGMLLLPVLVAHTVLQSFQHCCVVPVLSLVLEEVQQTVVPVVAHSIDDTVVGNIGSSCHILHIVGMLRTGDPLLPYLELHIPSSGPAVAVADADFGFEAGHLPCQALAVVAVAVVHVAPVVVVANRLQLADILPNIHKQLAAFAVGPSVVVLRFLRDRHSAGMKRMLPYPDQHLLYHYIVLLPELELIPAVAGSQTLIRNLIQSRYRFPIQSFQIEGSIQLHRQRCCQVVLSVHSQQFDPAQHLVGSAVVEYYFELLVQWF